MSKSLFAEIVRSKIDFSSKSLLKQLENFEKSILKLGKKRLKAAVYTGNVLYNV